MGPALLDALAEFGAGLEDLKDDDPAEDGEGWEDDDECDGRPPIRSRFVSCVVNRQGLAGRAASPEARGRSTGLACVPWVYRRRHSEGAINSPRHIPAAWRSRCIRRPRRSC